jgi:chitinase
MQRCDALDGDRERLHALLRSGVWLYNASTETFYTYDDPFTAILKMIYVDARELGGAYVWAAKDDDASGTMIKTMARWLGR